MAYIYKITNTQNGKIYVGKTLESVEKRFKEHCKDSKKQRCEKRPLYDAMNKYGIESFKVETIEQCSEAVVNEREIYWIEKLDSFHNGYNATKGGDGKRYANYDLIYSLWQEGKLLKEIQEITGYDKHTIRKALEENNVSIEERKNRGWAALQTPVAMLDKTTEEIIKIFSSTQEATEYLNIDRNGRVHINEVCRGKCKTAYGYKWRRLDA